MLSVRIVTTDHYLAAPLAGLDVCRSEFRRRDVKKVPVIRIYGSTPKGQKACMHIHGVFPYIYVPHDPSLGGEKPSDDFMQSVASALDRALNITMGNASSSQQHVFKISAVCGTAMYGFHHKESYFMKIYFYNPYTVYRAADLLLSGAVLNRSFQPHEAHVPYALQFFIDYCLYGMNMITVSAAKFRVSKGHALATADGTSSGEDGYWNPYKLSPELIIDPEIAERTSTCELELDVMAGDILNRSDSLAMSGTNPGLMALWTDERRRRKSRGLSSQVAAPISQVRAPYKRTSLEQKWLDRFHEVVSQATVLPGDDHGSFVIPSGGNKETAGDAVNEDIVKDVMVFTQNLENAAEMLDHSDLAMLLARMAAMNSSTHIGSQVSQRSSCTALSQHTEAVALMSPPLRSESCGDGSGNVARYPATVTAARGSGVSVAFGRPNMSEAQVASAASAAAAATAAAAAATAVVADVDASADAADARVRAGDAIENEANFGSELALCSWASQQSDLSCALDALYRWSQAAEESVAEAAIQSQLNLAAGEDSPAVDPAAGSRIADTSAAISGPVTAAAAAPSLLLPTVDVASAAQAEMRQQQPAYASCFNFGACDDDAFLAPRTVNVLPDEDARETIEMSQLIWDVDDDMFPGSPSSPQLMPPLECTRADEGGQTDGEIVQMQVASAPTKRQFPYQLDGAGDESDESNGSKREHPKRRRLGTTSYARNRRLETEIERQRINSRGPSSATDAGSYSAANAGSAASVPLPGNSDIAAKLDCCSAMDDRFEAVPLVRCGSKETCVLLAGCNTDSAVRRRQSPATAFTPSPPSAAPSTDSEQACTRRCRKRKSVGSSGDSSRSLRSTAVPSVAASVQQQPSDAAIRLMTISPTVKEPSSLSVWTKIDAKKHVETPGRERSIALATSGTRGGHGESTGMSDHSEALQPEQGNELLFAERSDRRSRRRRRLSSIDIGTISSARRRWQQQQQLPPPPPLRHPSWEQSANCSSKAPGAVPLSSLLGPRAAALRDTGRLTVPSSYADRRFYLEKIGLEQVHVTRLDIADTAAETHRGSTAGDASVAGADADLPIDARSGALPQGMQTTSPSGDATAFLANRRSPDDSDRVVKSLSAQPRSPTLHPCPSPTPIDCHRSLALHPCPSPTPVDCHRLKHDFDAVEASASCLMPSASYFVDGLDDHAASYCDVLSNMSLFSDPDSSCDSPPSPQTALGQSPSGCRPTCSRSSRWVSWGIGGTSTSPVDDDSTSSISSDLVLPTQTSFPAAVQRERFREGGAFPEGHASGREFGKIAATARVSASAISGHSTALVLSDPQALAVTLSSSDESDSQQLDSPEAAPLAVPALQAFATVASIADTKSITSQSLVGCASSPADRRRREEDDDEVIIESLASLRPPSSSPSNLSISSSCQQLEDGIEILDDSIGSSAAASLHATRQQRSIGTDDEDVPAVDCGSGCSSAVVMGVRGKTTRTSPPRQLPVHASRHRSAAGDTVDGCSPPMSPRCSQSSLPPSIYFPGAYGSNECCSIVDNGTVRLPSPVVSIRNPCIPTNVDRPIMSGSPVRHSQTSAPPSISPLTSPRLHLASGLPFCSTPAKPPIRALPEATARGAAAGDSGCDRLMRPADVSPVATAATAAPLADFLSDILQPCDDASGDAWSSGVRFHSSTVDDIDTVLFDNDDASSASKHDVCITDDSCLSLSATEMAPGRSTGGATAATATAGTQLLQWVPVARPPSYDSVSSSCLDFGLGQELAVHPHFTDSTDYRKAAKDSMVSACCSKFETRLLSELSEYCGTVATLTRRPHRLIAAVAADCGNSSSNVTSASGLSHRQRSWVPLLPPPTCDAVRGWLAAFSVGCSDAGKACAVAGAAERATITCAAASVELNISERAAAAAAAQADDSTIDQYAHTTEAGTNKIVDRKEASIALSTMADKCGTTSDRILRTSDRSTVNDRDDSAEPRRETEPTLERKDADGKEASSDRSSASDDSRCSMPSAAAAPVSQKSTSAATRGDAQQPSLPIDDADLSFDPARRRVCLPSSVLAYDDLPVAIAPQRAFTKSSASPHSGGVPNAAAAAAASMPVPSLAAPAPPICYVTPHERSSSSRVDGASLDNTYGFERSLYEAASDRATLSGSDTDQHRQQHLTVMGVEMHANARGSLTADPMVDAVAAIFVHVHSDTDPAAADDLSIICWSPTTAGAGHALPEPLQPFTNQHPTKADGVITADCSGQATPGVSSTNVATAPDSRIHGCSESNLSAGAQETVGRRCRANYCYGLRNVTLTELAAELDVVMAFVELVKKWDPDILHGWEVQSRSLGYLVQRCRFLKLDLLDLLSRAPKKTTSPEKVPDDKTSSDSSLQYDNQLRIGGRIVLNMWRVMRHEVTLNVYTIENVIYHVLHERLPKFTDETLTAWYNNRQLYRQRTLAYYSVRTRSLYRMMDEIDLIGQTSEFARIYGIEFYEVLSRGSQFKVESMMLRLAKPLSYVAVSPSVQQRVRMRAPECIQLTLEPESKFYADPVVVVDFQSLYPSIMIAYNYCYSTCLGRVESLAKADGDFFPFGCTSNRVPGHILKKLENDVTVSPNGIVFVKQHVRKGILSQMVEEILNTRIMVKQSMKLYGNDKGLQRLLHARQLGLKLIANVTFGYTAANFSGRMPCVEIGDSILRKSRETLESAIKLVETTEKWRARVVYGDTDSMFILLAGRSKDEAFRIGQEIADAVTAANPSPVKLKFEKVYLPCILETKKRYVGYAYESASQKEPLFDAKGIETVRRDGCPAATKVLERALRLLFDTRDITAVKSYVQKQCSKVLDGRTNLLDFVFAKEYRGSKGYKPGACVPSLEIARRRLAADPRSEPLVGERVPYVFVYGRPGAPLIELAREPADVLAAGGSVRVNGAYYVTKQILPPLGRALSLLGVNVFAWYDELPRTSALAHGGGDTRCRLRAGLSSSTSGQHEGSSSIAAAATAAGTGCQRRNRGTLSQYFVSSRCLVCGENGRGKLCDECQSRPQATAMSLGRRLQAVEREIQQRRSVCTTCAGFASPDELPCWSLDCTNMTRHRKALQLLAASTDLYDALFRW